MGEWRPEARVDLTLSRADVEMLALLDGAHPDEVEEDLRHGT